LWSDQTGNLRLQAYIPRGLALTRPAIPIYRLIAGFGLPVP
jgi:hypothetical protein